MTPRRRRSAPPTHTRSALAQWDHAIERSSDFGFAYRATRRVTVQYLDNLNFADPRALWLTECTLDGRDVLLARDVPATALHRFASHGTGPMRLTLQPGQLLRFKVRNRSPRNLELRLLLIGDTPL